MQLRGITFIIGRVGSVRRGRGEGGAGAGGLFFRPGRFVFQPKYWANLFKCVFFCFILLFTFLRLAVRISWPFFFFNFFYTGF